MTAKFQFPVIGPVLNLRQRIDTWLQIKDVIPSSGAIVLTIPGTGHPDPSASYRTNFPLQIANLLNKDYYSVCPIVYPASLMFLPSVNSGFRACLHAINSTDPGQKIVIIGYSQGAMVASAILKEFQSGSLASRYGDLLCVIVMGNPCRKAGSIAPGITDPGGHGIADSAHRLTTVPSQWWEFAIPNDLAATPTDDTVGQWLTALFMCFWGSSNDLFPAIKNTIITAATAGIDLVPALNELMSYVDGNPTSAHGQYNTYKPLSGSGDNRTFIQIGADYLNSLVPV